MHCSAPCTCCAGQVTHIMLPARLQPCNAAAAVLRTMHRSTVLCQPSSICRGLGVTEQQQCPGAIARVHEHLACLTTAMCRARQAASTSPCAQVCKVTAPGLQLQALQPRQAQEQGWQQAACQGPAAFPWPLCSWCTQRLAACCRGQSLQPPLPSSWPLGWSWQAAEMPGGWSLRLGCPGAAASLHSRHDERLSHGTSS